MLFSTCESSAEVSRHPRSLKGTVAGDVHVILGVYHACRAALKVPKAVLPKLVAVEHRLLILGGWQRRNWSFSSIPSRGWRYIACFCIRILQDDLQEPSYSNTPSLGSYQDTRCSPRIGHQKGLPAWPPAPLPPSAWRIAGRSRSAICKRRAWERRAMVGGTEISQKYLLIKHISTH